MLVLAIFNLKFEEEKQKILVTFIQVSTNVHIWYGNCHDRPNFIDYTFLGFFADSAALQNSYGHLFH